MKIPAPTDYKTLRLNAGHRTKLCELARMTLRNPNEEAVEAAAFDVLIAAIYARIDELVPPADLDVLARYNGVVKAFGVRIRNVPVFGTQDSEVVQTRNSFDIAVCFCPRDVRAVSGPNAGCHRRTTAEGAVSRPIPTGYRSSADLGDHYATVFDFVDLKTLGPAVLDAYVTWAKAKAATDAARERVLRTLYSVIESRRTLQAVAEVWPHAMSLADKFRAIAVVAEEEATQLDALKSASFA